MKQKKKDDFWLIMAILLIIVVAAFLFYDIYSENMVERNCKTMCSAKDMQFENIDKANNFCYCKDIINRLEELKKEVENV